jgi:hypothetical protein
MPKVSDIMEVKKIVEDKFKQLYSNPQNIEIRRANQYTSLGVWYVAVTMSINGKVRYYSLTIEIETGNVKEYSESI